MAFVHRPAVALALLALPAAAPAQATLAYCGHVLPLETRASGLPVISLKSYYRLQRVTPPDEVAVLIDVGERLDWRRIEAVLVEEEVPRAERGRWILEALEELSRYETDLLEELLARRHADLGLRRPPPVTRALPTLGWLHVRLTRSAVERLMTQDGLHRIEVLEESFAGQPPVEDVSGDPASREDDAGWATRAVHAASAWNLGLCGEGRLVALLDGGWGTLHEAIGDRAAPGSDEGPRRPGSHGTAALSAALGHGPDGDPIGPAPAARWIAADPFPLGINDPSRLDSIGRWLLEQAPDAVLLPWSIALDDAQNLDELFSAWRTAGTLVVIAGGNLGPASGTNTIPASIGGLGPDDARAFSVGATGPGDRAYTFSSRGPSSATGDLFPVLAAPGTDLVLASDPPAGYVVAQGTSFAIGYVAGAAALLREIDPGIDVPALEHLLTSTARDIDPPGPDMTFGHGLVDIRAALQAMGLKAE